MRKWENTERLKLEFINKAQIQFSSSQFPTFPDSKPYSFLFIFYLSTMSYELSTGALAPYPLSFNLDEIVKSHSNDWIPAFAGTTDVLTIRY